MGGVRQLVIKALNVATRYREYFRNTGEVRLENSILKSFMLSVIGLQKAYNSCDYDIYTMTRHKYI